MSRALVVNLQAATNPPKPLIPQMEAKFRHHYSTNPHRCGHGFPFPLVRCRKTLFCRTRLRRGRGILSRLGLLHDDDVILWRVIQTCQPGLRVEPVRLSCPGSDLGLFGHLAGGRSCSCKSSRWLQLADTDLLRVVGSFNGIASMNSLPAVVAGATDLGSPASRAAT